MILNSEYHIGTMTWPEYQQRLATATAIFLPIGALEQHGPHLPMACDAILATAMASRAAKELDGILLPALSYGYKSQARSGGGQTFTGTTSLDGQTLSSQVRDIIRELARHGASRLVIVNGHVENQWFITEGIELALREVHESNDMLRVIRCEYWDYTPQAVLEEIFEGDFPGIDLEHAALLETSMMLALHPELVREALIPDDPLASFPAHDHYPQDGRDVPSSGVLAPAGRASRAIGEKLIENTIEAMVAALRPELIP